MITIEDIANKAGLTRTAVMYRIKQLEEAGAPISESFKRGKVGSIRVYSEDDLQAIINYKARKPGRKRKQEDKPTCSHCNGSGEGMHDGTKCKSCKGLGVEDA